MAIKVLKVIVGIVVVVGLYALAIVEVDRALTIEEGFSEAVVERYR